ncbi:hypothetical protein KPSB59_1700008 [Klebsiella quasipneumoniae subsp. quasipneumoniae]|nr:hypothetical protein KPSB59_1700008 [Klebsiella quasipneumoniae subsp. quasipneumoniae]
MRFKAFRTDQVSASCIYSVNIISDQEEDKQVGACPPPECHASFSIGPTIGLEPVNK